MVGRRRGVASKSSSHFSLQRWLTNRTSNSSLRSSNAVKDSGVVPPDDPVWICSAKNDEAGQFVVAKSDTEDRAIAELCELIGIDLADGQAWRSRANAIWEMPDKQMTLDRLN